MGTLIPLPGSEDDRLIRLCSCTRCGTLTAEAFAEIKQLRAALEYCWPRDRRVEKIGRALQEAHAQWVAMTIAADRD